ncbi:hypothetical protein ABJI51_16610 [Amycolatopsis sp. NEAU-NG30]|uniref:Uncharacterized protein n=1 Tax=Amycolatopsis melonis TaxID=3156488 RepID=A0ABV0LEJ2_9PSEU
MTTPPSAETAAVAQAAAADAACTSLQAWARHRDQLPQLRAELVALAWQAGNRNVAALARDADVSRDTIYADLRAHGIDAADQAARRTAATPRYQPLTADAIAGLGKLVEARIISAMLTDRPQPEAAIAWQAGIILSRIEAMLGTPAGTMTDLTGTETVNSRADQLQDLIDRATMIVEDARKVLAGELTHDQVAARAVDDQVNTLGGALEPVVMDATLRLVVPNEDVPQPIAITLAYRDGKLIEVDSESPLVDGQLDRTAHLAIHHAFDIITRALRPVLADRAYFTSDEGRGEAD